MIAKPTVDELIPDASGKKLQPWSISTTVRNPARIVAFLRILKDALEGSVWNKEAQTEFQVRLIQHRMYGVFSSQFYANLTEADIDLLESERDISYAEAREIFGRKNYEDPPMRGRTSFKPLQKLGFANLADGKVKITKAGNALLGGEVSDSDLFLRSFLKWQLPNHLDKSGFPESMGYCLKPYVSVLRLIKEVNRLCEDGDLTPVGISQTELGLFALTLVRWDEVGEVAAEILEHRKDVQGQSLQPWQRDNLLLEKSPLLRPSHQLRHIRDYADNTVRYFRLTGLIRLRGVGRYIDLEPVRMVEIDALLDEYSGEPIIYTDEEYTEILGDHTVPLLPWETHRELERVAVSLIDGIEEIAGEGSIVREDYTNKPIAEMKSLVEGLRERRHSLVAEKVKRDMELPAEIRDNIDHLRGLTRRTAVGMQKSLALEWRVTTGMVALNDAIDIKPNYPKGDDGMPRAHAPGGKPDIECFYEGFSCICEVTMIRDRSQWVKEGQPVMRHLRDFEDSRSEQDEAVYGLFIAPTIHRDTLNTFWNSVKHGYEGRIQKIIHLTIEQFCSILHTCLELREQERSVTKMDIRNLLDALVELADTVESSLEWNSQTPEVISKWSEEVLAGE